MTRFITFLLTTLLFNVASAQQPKWAKNVSKSIFVVKTFDSENKLIGNSNGFFIGENGEAVSNFAIFDGASKAIIIDWQDKTHEVEAIIGANETYDIVKFKVSSSSAQPLSIASAQPAVDEKVWLVPYSVKKTPDCKLGTVLSAEKFQGDYHYYTIELAASDLWTSCPFFNANGELFGLLQLPASEKANDSYAVDAAFAKQLSTNGLSINDLALRKIKIKKALPPVYDQAVMAMYLAALSADSTNFAETVNDFIRQYPEKPDGYTYRAEIHFSDNRFAEADKDMVKAIDASESNSDTHFAYARMILQKILYKNNIPFDNWTLDKAIEEVDKAYAINAIPAYKQLKAQILYSQNKYSDALQLYEQLAADDYNKTEVYLEASKCKKAVNDTTGMIALLDSAVATLSRPYLKEAAPVILSRAEAYLSISEYRKAVADLNEYERLMASEVNDNFYYIREQAELNSHMYKQALDDIAMAISKNPREPVYYAEKASLEIRFGMYHDAEITAQECINTDSNSSDGYLLLGYAQCLNGNKADGLKNLRKAKDLGNSQAEELITKYQQ